jgi:hypothetical protein
VLKSEDASVLRWEFSTVGIKCGLLPSNSPKCHWEKDFQNKAVYGMVFIGVF